MGFLQKRLLSFRYAFQGLSELFSSQPNARIHILASIVAILLGLWCHISRLEWVSISFCITMVLAMEAVNTALEFLTDLVSPGHHPLAGKAKDLAAAAVLITAIGAAVVGAIIFLPYFFK